MYFTNSYVNPITGQIQGQIPGSAPEAFRAPVAGVSYAQPQYAPLFATVSPVQPQHAFGFDNTHTIYQKLDLLSQQVAFLSDLVRRLSPEYTMVAGALANSARGAFGTQSYGTGGGIPNYQHLTGSLANEFSPGRMRESDSHIFWDLYLPSLVMSDIDVEVSGNRVICRTRIPVSAVNRWWHHGIPLRGLEIYEMPDGRVEFNWVVPVAFSAREVEASWREGWISICIPKSESSQRQTVKVGKEQAGGRKGSSHELNA